MRSARFRGSSEPIRLLHAERAGAANRGHLERGPRAQRPRIDVGVLVQQRRDTHRLEHVEVVVAGRAVGAEADADVGAQIGRHRRRPARQLHVALGIVRDADAARLEDRDVGIGDPDAVRAEHAGAEEAEAVEIRDRRRLEPLLRGLNLVARLGEMDQRGDVVTPRQIARGLQRRAVERVHRMRRDGGRDERVVLERLDERLGADEAVGGRLGVGDRETE